jgi:hypothetical protein
MIWQILAAALVGSLFYLRKVVLWIGGRLGPRSNRPLGYLFASFFALVTSPLVCKVFEARPLPRFSDVFLVGIVLTSYLFSWDAAAYLLVLSLLVSAWILPPYGSLAITGGAEWYRLISFAALSVFLICLISRLKTRREMRKPRLSPMLQSMATGD